MRFSLSLPHYGFSFPDGRPPSFDEAAAWATRAEELGFDGVMVSDHFIYSFARFGAGDDPIASLEPLTLLAGLAAVTDRVRLSVLALGSPFRHPGTVAKMAATIDLVSGGRLDLGVGAGWLEQEFDAFGYRYGSVGDRFDALTDTLAVLRGLFDAGDESFTHEGTTASVHEARLVPSPIQRPVPIWVGGKGGPRLLRLAARYAAGWNVVWRFTDGWYRERLDAVAAACEAEGRDPGTFRRTVGFHALLGADEGAARQVYARGQAAMPGGTLDDTDWETWCAETLSGTPERVRARVATMAALGVEEIVVAPWVLPNAIHEPEQVELFAEHVIAPSRG